MEVELMTRNGKLIRSKIDSRTAKVCIIGLGYVGVPLAVASAKAGFDVSCVDVDKAKVDSINKGISHVEDPYSEKLLPDLVRKGKIKATTRLVEGAMDANVVVICVQTPLDKKGIPDLSFVKQVTRGLSKLLSNYKLIILESTSYPGTTQEVVLPILMRGKSRTNQGFGLVYSPERIDYGNPKYNVSKIPKVVGGIDNESTMLGASFYEAIIEAPVFKVSSPSVAEASKMLENIFRYVNIALVNELAVLHEKLGVDFVETIQAAATKPFGFMPHYPGPGVGGHCIPKDPFYLVYKAKKLGMNLRLVATAKAVNTMMPRHVVERLDKALTKQGKKLDQSTVALWGLAYKGQVRDTRRSPAVDILKLLRHRKAKVKPYDPFVPSLRLGTTAIESTGSIEESVQNADCILIATAHKAFGRVNLRKLAGKMNQHPLMFDSRNMLSRASCEAAGFRYLGTGRP